MTHYFLPYDVFFCLRGDAVVFLDLNNDEYTLLEGQQAASLRKLCASASTTDWTRDDGNSVSEFIDEGLLTTDSERGRPLTATLVEVPLHDLLTPDNIPKVRVRLAHIVIIFMSCVRASFQLRFRNLKTVIAAVARRKARARTAACDWNRTRELIAIFNKVRPFFPRNYLCLYDSLALLEFLSHYGAFPTWVFAISLEPWEAHCWVQDGEHVINEGVEEAASYTAVMAI
jgi:hypothetical protein